MSALMKSAIQLAMQEITEVSPSARKNETIVSQEYMKRLVLAVADVPEDDWNGLSAAAQDWYNAATDSIAKGEDISPYSDLPKEEPAPTGRRRGAAPAAEAPFEPKVGAVVDITTKRGKSFTGKITVMDDEGLVLETADGEQELTHAAVATITQAGVKPADNKQPEPETPPEPEVGDTVEVVTARDKVIVGNITILEGDDLVLVDAAGAEHELTKGKLKSIKVKVKNSKAGGKAEDKKPAAKADTKEPAEKKEKGPSVTGRMRELCCQYDTETKEQIADRLKKEGFEFKPATLDISYNEVAKIISILRDLKKMK